ncbi:linear amide C-N hydrolase [Levilactobacillus acidifarinae]|uniref:Choloylglycine hydrolase n=1 Tax=Levilactobacillus acidifarinae DSM 19394 = JCM 15949 TaxID=1423715 RepID=A0A0R1LPV0_9LACO|nr:linear amide C-N hydrolase [Levilactobacillus acidifarinae]KRK95651.1 choloylglycine hydrolase [Levilactobacillus acidifarinae DSM 19394]GEO69387.1 penicillin V acylase [Levilactobacillus acidifarinae]
MCTSLTYTNGAGQHFFARTMDFPTTTPWRPIFLPRDYRWMTALQTRRMTRYALLGGGRLAVDRPAYLMADGINERGLTCAELYLPGATTYADEPLAGKVNLTPQDFINWALGEHATLAEIVADLPQVRLVSRRWGNDRYVYPFHWILSDRTGQTLVIEPTELTLHAQIDTSGVLTNTPVLATHLHNLNQFLHVPGDTFQPATITAAREYLTSSAPLPTGPVPTDRFIRTAITRWGTPLLPTSLATQRAIFAWLAAVSLPYHPERRHERNHNYTHYRSLINLNTLSYTFIPRTTHRLQQIKLTPRMAASRHSPHVYPAN